MSRKKKLLLNTLTGIIKQVVTVICGFILPRYMLSYYGSSINGLVSSITNFLGFISLLDMGVGAVIQANLYKPLADEDNNKISQLVLSSERFFRKLGYIFIIYIIILCIIFPKMINSNYEPIFTISLLIIISISTLAQYLFGMTNQLLLNADQKSYVQLTIQIITIIMNTFLAVFLMKIGMPVHIVKLVSALVFVLRPMIQNIYVKKYYSIDRHVKIIGEPIKQKWNGFSQHFAAVVCQNIDIAVLTLFSSLKNVSVYSVYYTVTNGVQQIVMTAATGLEAMFGNMIANHEDQKLLKVFTSIEWLIHFGVTIIFTITSIIIVPFVSVYTKGITDANYNVPLFAMVLVLAYGMQCLRVPYFRIIKAAGHFKQTQNGAYISAVINVIVTVLFVFKFGLVGAALGTLFAMTYHTVYFAWYLRKNIIHRDIKYFIKYLLVDSFVFFISYMITNNMNLAVISYIEWIILSIKISLVVLVISFIINLIFYKNNIHDVLNLMRKKM